MKMRDFFRRGPGFLVICLLPFVLGASECNTFSGGANKTSDAAILFAAQAQINAQNYTDAITTLNGLSATAAASHDGLATMASAHAGACGLNLVTMANDVSKQLGSAKTIMQLMMTEMHAATSIADCTAAETLLQQIVTAQMTPDDQIFLAFVEFAKMGAVLVTSPSVTTNPCLAVNISDFNVGAVGASINIAVKALTASGVSIASSLGTALNTVCAPTGPANCAIYTPTGFSAIELLAIRTAINSQEVGLNVCSGSITTPACVCTHN